MSQNAGRPLASPTLRLSRLLCDGAPDQFSGGLEDQLDVLATAGSGSMASTSEQPPFRGRARRQVLNMDADRAKDVPAPLFASVDVAVDETHGHRKREK
jgi:hypothetical protein